MAQREPASRLILGPSEGLLNIQTSGEFQPYGFIANRLAGISARLTISFRKSNSAAYGPQDPRPDRRGCPGQRPQHPKEWCNMALYARGQPAATNGCRPAPAAPRWC